MTVVTSEVVSPKDCRRVVLWAATISSWNNTVSRRVKKAWSPSLGARPSFFLVPEVLEKPNKGLTAFRVTHIIPNVQEKLLKSHSVVSPRLQFNRNSSRDAVL